MAKREQVNILRRGVGPWNEWLKTGKGSRPDLAGANLSRLKLPEVNLMEAILYQTNLSGAVLSRANLARVSLYQANLSQANLTGAILKGANLSKANLSRANLTGANLTGANLAKANLAGANLTGANLSRAKITDTDLAQAILVETNLREAEIIDCAIYGISVWGIRGEPKNQSGLIITPSHQPTITVDNLKVAQFIYLLLENKEVRDVIDTITSKVVLILGRFTPERKEVLDAIREKLRRHNYTPILFDFAKPTSRDLTETVGTLARMSRFIIADLTDAKSIPQKLA
jgi:pentapeptide repeat protein